MITQWWDRCAQVAARARERLAGDDGWGPDPGARAAQELSINEWLGRKL